MTTDLDTRYQRARQTLDQHGQSHLLSFYDQLEESGKRRLLDQIEGQDWPRISELIQSHVLQRPEFEMPENLEPAPTYPPRPTDDLLEKYAKARAAGERLVQQGKVAGFTVAGGQGTRLGWDAPKGTFPASPVQGKPLFQLFAEHLIKTGEKFGHAIPWFIMTSPNNDQPTREFFAEHDHFGLAADQVTFFPQGTMPSIAFDGKVMLKGKDSIALNPDGHGGSLKALYASGSIKKMQEAGIEYISYWQVDNPLVKCIDPLFIGLHHLDGSQMSSKMIPKLYGMEKLGNFAMIDDRLHIIEYSDLPEHLAEQRAEDGELRFRAGSPAIHVLSVDFVAELNKDGRIRLPMHRAEKKVPRVDPETGKQVEPEKPNGVKLEMFVFDALPLCETSIILETSREEEVAQIKNAEGENSPAGSRQMQSDRAGRWLAEVGVDVPFDDEGHAKAAIEISPLTAVEPMDLKELPNLPEKIEPGDEVIL